MGIKISDLNGHQSMTPEQVREILIKANMLGNIAEASGLTGVVDMFDEYGDYDLSIGGENEDGTYSLSTSLRNEDNEAIGQVYVKLKLDITFERVEIEEEE